MLGWKPASSEVEEAPSWPSSANVPETSPFSYHLKHLSNSTSLPSSSCVSLYPSSCILPFFLCVCTSVLPWMLGPLELELQIAVSCMWVLGIEPWSSRIAVSALNHRAISPAPSCFFFFFFLIILCPLMATWLLALPLDLWLPWSYSQYTSRKLLD